MLSAKQEAVSTVFKVFNTTRRGNLSRFIDCNADALTTTLVGIVLVVMILVLVGLFNLVLIVVQCV